MIIRYIHSSILLLVFLRGTHQLFKINLNISTLMYNLIIITFLFLFLRILLFFLVFDHATLGLILLTFRLVLGSRLRLLVFLVRHFVHGARNAINDSTAKSAGMIPLCSGLIFCGFSIFAPFLWNLHISIISHLNLSHITHINRIQ